MPVTTRSKTTKPNAEILPDENRINIKSTKKELLDEIGSLKTSSLERDAEINRLNAIIEENQVWVEF